MWKCNGGCRVNTSRLHIVHCGQPTCAPIGYFPTPPGLDVFALPGSTPMAKRRNQCFPKSHHENRMNRVERPLRVAWLAERSRSGNDGLATYSRETVQGLRRRGVEVVAFHHRPEASDEESVALSAIEISDRFRIERPGARRRLSQALRQRRVDLVHVSLSFSSLDFALPEVCERLGLPLVATVHAPFDTRPTVWGSLSRVLYRIYAVPLARCHRVIVFGSEQLEVLASMGVPRSVLRVVPNGVDVERYRPGPSDWRERLGAERLFVYLGRLDPEKNVETLVEAFLEVDPPAGLRLALAGGGSERRRLERRCRGEPRVVFLGVLADEEQRIGLLRAAEAFFLPSAIEGLSLALLEAMACGVCPVATGVGCDGEAVRGCGIRLDPTSLGPGLRLAIELLCWTPGLADELGRLARQRVVERYSLERNLDALLDLYGELVKPRLGAGAQGSLSG